MDDITTLNGGLPPDRPLAPSALAEVLRAHDLATRLVEQVCELHVALPDRLDIRDRIGPFLTEAASIEDSIVVELRRLLEADLTAAEVELVRAHGRQLFDVRPLLGLLVYELLLYALARQAGLHAAA